MKTNHIAETVPSSYATSGVPDADTPSRLGGTLSSLKSRSVSGASRVRESAPRRARQAQQAVRSRPATAAATALAAVAAVAAVFIGRRRASKARVARSRRLAGFLRR
ncbi:hypothetical protein [Couchioplanes caeruleus]|uniref:Uncharacterized protein n=2 Tax=Couchioplanes caeruleus TaxID=56438 RepID=A0A1K0FMW5_9ACTN|nr:hypothetical protein [Couchioplanes caeruleus]OJF14064.1 hypothetical protein BG844_11810 [Couchioplanes caeruleus subsp. caeruleus]ROP30845.1 hypothetical protein EDD30_3709 [Couchioplanes caeruleus]